MADSIFRASPQSHREALPLNIEANIRVGELFLAISTFQLGSPEDYSYNFSPFKPLGKDRWRRNKEKSLLLLQLSHPTAPQLMQQVNISSPQS